MIENKEVIENIKDIDSKIKEEINSNNIDKEKLFKLRYQQMIQGLYLNNVMFK